MPSSSPEDASDESGSGLVLAPMGEEHLEQVLRIEQASFPSPWRREHFLHEIHENAYAINRVLRRGEQVVGYASVWVIDRELRINNIAVGAGERRGGLGGLLLRRLLDYGRQRGCREANLEVRPSNTAARALYRKHGFVEVGVRRNYYALEGEDGLLMALRL